MDADEIAHKQELIKEHIRTLRELELQAARYGEFDVPVYIRKQIRGVKEEIKSLEIDVGIKSPIPSREAVMSMVALYNEVDNTETKRKLSNDANGSDGKPSYRISIEKIARFSIVLSAICVFVFFTTLMLFARVGESNRFISTTLGVSLAVLFGGFITYIVCIAIIWLSKKRSTK
jgi:hypothetical protein